MQPDTLPEPAVEMVEMAGMEEMLVKAVTAHEVERSDSAFLMTKHISSSFIVAATCLAVKEAQGEHQAEEASDSKAIYSCVLPAKSVPLQVLVEGAAQAAHHTHIQSGIATRRHGTQILVEAVGSMGHQAGQVHMHYQA
jgi:hypothetical protein